MTREEAISRIENHVRIHSKQEPFRACHIQEALEMAIEALKAQEPRVMTIQEVARCSMCWLEDESALVPALFISMEKRANGEKCDVFLAVKPDNDDCEFWYNIDEYGKTWCCWTSRPTDEQRGAIPWN